jgi:hypothetical protein
MSSVESMISDIQNAFVELVNVVDSYKIRKVISESDALQFLSMTVSFQRKLEYYKESSSIFSGRPYFQRTLKRFDDVIYYFSTDNTVHQYFTNQQEDSYQTRDLRGSYYVYTDDCEGIIFETKDIILRTRHKTMSAVARSIMFIDNLLHQEVQTCLVELYGDLRLLADLTIFPIETKLKIKSQLVDNGFKQVAEYLEIAEENYGLTPPHLKDTLSNCRNALESAITIISKSLGLQSTQRFSIDAGALQSSGFLDRETKDVVLSVWSYLSMKGSHSYSTVDKKSMSDVDFGVEQTYRIIAQLLTKYQDWGKKKVP